MNPQDLVAKGLSPELAVFLTSMLPIIELRGALPLAINLFNLSWPKAFIIAYIGNMIPVLIILWLLDPAVKLLSRIGILKRFFDWLFERTRKRSTKMIEKYEEIGLMAFVAIPLPGTGGWTGALVAFLFGLDVRTSLAVIAIGVFIAGVIVTTLCLLGWVGAIIAGSVLAILAAAGFWRL
jgi:uncharacterized membrane protein